MKVLPFLLMVWLIFSATFAWLPMPFGPPLEGAAAIRRAAFRGAVATVGLVVFVESTADNGDPLMAVMAALVLVGLLVAGLSKARSRRTQWTEDRL